MIQNQGVTFPFLSKTSSIKIVVVKISGVFSNPQLRYAHILSVAALSLAALAAQLFSHVHDGNRGQQVIVRRFVVSYNTRRTQQCLTTPLLTHTVWVMQNKEY